MIAKQVAHGFFGGLLGFTFAGPLVLHEGWMRMARYKEKNPTTRNIYYAASFLIFPLLMMLGILGSPMIGAYTAYQCGKESSLEPLFQTIKAPYQGSNPENRYELNISRGMLIGYSVVLTLLSFTLINMVAGNVFGLLAAPGKAILSAFLPAQTGLVATGFMSMALCYMGGIFGGISAACYTKITPPSHLPATLIFKQEEDYIPLSSYHLMDDSDSEFDIELENSSSNSNGFTKDSVIVMDNSTESSDSNTPFFSTQSTTALLNNIPRLQTVLHRWDSYWNKNTQSGSPAEEMQTFNSSYAEFDDEEDIIVVKPS